MLAFAIRGSIADVDQTVEGEPRHPAIVIIVAAAESLTRVIVDSAQLVGRQELLTVGRKLEVSGEVLGFPRQAVHVADELELVPDQLH
jgi:hypothetical protein